MHFLRLRSPLLAGMALLLIGVPTSAADHSIVAGFERFYTSEKADVAKGGQLLLGELNCISCHQAENAGRKQAPILDLVAERVRVSWLRKYIADPQAVKRGGTMPNLFAGDPDKDAKVEALVHFLASSGALKQERSDIKGMILGKDLYAKVGCVACHGPRDLTGNAEKNLPGYTVALGDLKSKYTFASLTAFLENPLQVRPSGRMPHLVQKKEAHDIANYLLQGIKIGLSQGIGSTSYSYYEGSWDSLPDFTKLKPMATGIGPGFDLAPAKRDNDYALKFDGVFKTEKEGQHKLTLTSDDGSRILIDGKVVVDNDGIHAPQTASGSTLLKKGIHTVEVQFFQGGGGAELSVEIEGSGFSRQPFNGLVAPTEADLSKKPEPVKAVDDADTIQINPELIEKGKALFASVGCANCHQMNVDKKPIASSLTATPLPKLKAEGGCLSNKPAKGIPAYGLSEKQRTALAAAIKTPPVESKEPAAVIARSMTTLNCYACHARDKIGGPTEEFSKFFTTTQPEMGDEARTPPPLDLVGAKLNPDYLKAILDKGAKDRPYMLTKMPGFGQENVSQLAQAFAAIDRLPAIAPVKFDITEAKVKIAGRQMLGGQAFSCINCHTYAGNKAEGVQGIDMVLMTKRLQRDWFYAYLLDPQKIRPGTRMPTGWVDGKSTLQTVLGGHTDQQIEAIWAYLRLGSSAQLPVGVGGNKSIPLVPLKEAIIYRNFIQGAGTRGIAVGYPERVHLAFDANEVRLAMLWQGAFIDAGKHWTDRGEGYVAPLGDNIMNLAPGVPFAALAKSDTAWPTVTAKEQGYKFHGYRLTPDDRPTFDYSFNDIKIEDFPYPSTVDKEPSMKRTIKLMTKKSVENLFFRAAIAKKIESLGDGWYKIDGWKMKIESESKAVIRSTGGKSELIVPINFREGTVKVMVEYLW